MNTIVTNINIARQDVRRSSGSYILPLEVAEFSFQRFDFAGKCLPFKLMRFLASIEESGRLRENKSDKDTIDSYC